MSRYPLLRQLALVVSISVRNVRFYLMLLVGSDNPCAIGYRGPTSHDA